MILDGVIIFLEHSAHLIIKFISNHIKLIFQTGDQTGDQVLQLYLEGQLLGLQNKSPLQKMHAAVVISNKIQVNITVMYYVSYWLVNWVWQFCTQLETNPLNQQTTHESMTEDVTQQDANLKKKELKQYR